MLDSSKDFQKGIYANQRQIDAKIILTMNGSSNVYDDTYITQMSIVEEMSTLNDSISSDELQVTLDNTNGIFNFLSISNMHQVIAQRPRIDVELGLVINKFTWSTFGAKNWSEV